MKQRASSQTFQDGCSPELNYAWAAAWASEPAQLQHVINYLSANNIASTPSQEDRVVVVVADVEQRGWWAWWRETKRRKRARNSW